ncbi:MAG TPA: flagellar basal body-associated FliL family protein [Solirubrobacter sp.]
MIKRLVLAAAVAALLVGAYKLTLGKPAPAVAHERVAVMKHQVIVDLAGGRYAAVTLGLEVPESSDEEIAESAVVQDVVTRDLTNLDPADLLVRERRERLKVRLARDIRAQTDVPVARVLLTDFTIH